MKREETQVFRCFHLSAVIVSVFSFSSKRRRSNECEREKRGRSELVSEYFLYFVDKQLKSSERHERTRRENV